jgi:hypothetical protein
VPDEFGSHATAIHGRATIKSQIPAAAASASAGRTAAFGLLPR